MSTTPAPASLSPILDRLIKDLSIAHPDLRPQLVRLTPSLVGTGGDGLDPARLGHLRKWVLGVYLPAWLEAAGLRDDAARYRAISQEAGLLAETAAYLTDDVLPPGGSSEEVLLTETAIRLTSLIRSQSELLETGAKIPFVVPPPTSPVREEDRRHRGIWVDPTDRSIGKRVVHASNADYFPGMSLLWEEDAFPFESTIFRLAELAFLATYQQWWIASDSDRSGLPTTVGERVAQAMSSSALQLLTRLCQQGFEAS